jgi:phenylalanyl-tRNA synthetase beta chain
MKVSLAWIFEHIDYAWQKVDVTQLVNQFNQKTAEIEHVAKIALDLKPLALARVTGLNGLSASASGASNSSEKSVQQKIEVHVPEWRIDCMLSFRQDAQVGDLFLIKKHEKGYSWAHLHDVGGEKESMLSAVFCEESFVSGDWKKNIEVHDYILDIDNKSITNRPDLWGHRGLAREFAALLDLQLKPIEPLLAAIPVIQIDGTCAKATNLVPYAIENKAPEACKRFAAGYVTCNAIASPLNLALCLSKVDCRPIDAIVDGTNYVMLELGQPLHAFDAQKFSAKKLMPRMAKNKEKLTLLDGQAIELCQDDLVISDGVIPVALAGVMGGADTAIGRDTKAILVEAACFDPGIVRRTASRHKVRTDASARFEKSLDPNQNVTALLRLLKLFDELGVAPRAQAEIISLGLPASMREITITHSFIEKRLGVTVDRTFIYQTLEKLGFGVDKSVGKGSDGYAITVPTYRGTKDITIAEDIVEEIGRFYGYTAIPPVLPKLALAASQHDWVYQVRTIKQYMAYTLSMRELYTYGMFDEDFLRLLSWEPVNTVDIKNPISENLRRMGTTLVPNMLKAVHQNCADYPQLRFFEWGRTWHYRKEVFEKKVLAGIIYEHKKEIDFYQIKAELEGLFALLALPVTWEKTHSVEQEPWYMPYQTAHIMYEGTKIGTVGKVNPSCLRTLCEGDAFVFELDGDALVQYKAPRVQFQPVPKYPDVSRDISMLVPVALTAQELKDVIAKVDKKIVSVSLVDFFEKAEWAEQRSLTFRFVIRDPNKTLIKQEADEVWDRVAASLKKVGAVIR